MPDGTHRRSNLIKIVCPVKFHFFVPLVARDGQLSTNNIVLLSKGEHNHPPPPLHRIAPDLKVKIVKVIHDYGLAEATARRIIASPFLPIILNGYEDLTYQHLALLNQ